jgi:sugar transferase (PEP-CTERM/EpsH1 system associated)
LKARPILVSHVIHHLVTGGLENGLINLINKIDPNLIRHSVLCMTDFNTFRDRITDKEVAVIALNKNPNSRDLSAQIRAFHYFRSVRPHVVHTRNLTALDAVVPAFLAGVPARIHGEHGRDMTDPNGTNKKFILLKKLHAPFINHWCTVSQDLATSLIERVGIADTRISHISNGVDLSRFEHTAVRQQIPGFSEPDHIVFGTVGRLQDVKEQWLLIEALSLLQTFSPKAEKARLVIVGEGPMRPRLEKEIADRNLSGKVLLAGSQNNVHQWLQSFDVFCLPSRAEGTSNTVLEAMASGLPVIATNVGGNPELVLDQITGLLIPHTDARKLGVAMAKLLDDKIKRVQFGESARVRACNQFSIDAMVARYTQLYLDAAKRS